MQVNVNRKSPSHQTRVGELIEIKRAPEIMLAIVLNWQRHGWLTSLISPTSRFFVSEPEPLASGGGPELAGVHGAEMVSAAATALPATKRGTNPFINFPRKNSSFKLRSQSSFANWVYENDLDLFYERQKVVISQNRSITINKLFVKVTFKVELAASKE